MSTSDERGDAGRPGSIIPGIPDSTDPTDEYPVGDRLGRDPSNLGDDVADEGDLLFPTPEPAPNNI